MKHEFNWTELKNCSKNDFSGIIILAYCLTIGYNKVISNDSRHLINLLKIANIPLYLFNQRYIVTNRDKSIISQYQCKEPQTYFSNTDFLMSNCNTREKVIYLYMLSHRKMTDNNNFIPKEYIKQKYWKNLFVRIEKDNLYFIPELSQRT